MPEAVALFSYVVAGHYHGCCVVSRRGSLGALFVQHTKVTRAVFGSPRSWRSSSSGHEFRPDRLWVNPCPVQDREPHPPSGGRDCVAKCSSGLRCQMVLPDPRIADLFPVCHAGREAFSHPASAPLSKSCGEMFSQSWRGSLLVPAPRPPPTGQRRLLV